MHHSLAVGVALAISGVLRANAETAVGTDTATVAEQPVAVTPAAGPYEDQYLIDDSLPGMPGPVAAADDLLGRRYLDLELGYYRGDDDFLGKDFERGARFRWGRETTNWGTFDLDAMLANVDSDYLGREADGVEGVVTLRQSALAASATTLLDTTVGHQRSTGSSLLHGGYRFRLPTSAMFGASANVSSDNQNLRFARGQTGRYRGARMLQFVDDGGRLTTVGFDRALASQFEVGAEIANIRGDDDIRDHTSLLAGMRYRTPNDKQEHSARLLLDDGGHTSFWTDSVQSVANAMSVRYGTFYFDPKVVWTDLPIANNQMGLYFRMDAGNARLRMSGGYDYLEYGLGPDSTSSSRTNTFQFSSMLRLRRALTFGTTASISDRRLTGLARDVQTVSRINAFTTINRRIGSIRIDLFRDDLDSRLPENARERDGVAGSFSWRLPEQISLTTELRFEHEVDVHGRTERTELSTLFRYSLFDNVSVGVNAGLFGTNGESYSEDSGLSLTADARWRFLQHWEGSVSVSRNQSDFEADYPPYSYLQGELGTTTFWLTVRHQRSSGRAFASLGRRQEGHVGTGRISGHVFFDENRDSIRQPSEQAAVGVVVLLDGRYEARTDALGYYSFEPVPTGEHEIIVLTEQLPLPWGLDDESPRRTPVAFRAGSTVDFPLWDFN